MSVKEQIEQIVKEIEVYSSHALFSLAKQKCLEFMEFVEKSDKIVNKETLLLKISNKINDIEKRGRSFQGFGESTKMSKKEFDVVKQMVCGPDDSDSDEAIWEVARACLTLGQYDVAMREFSRLVEKRFKAVSAAKNILRCYIGMSAIDEAIDKYKDWSLSGLFTLGQMENIRTFLQELLYKNNIDRLVTNSRVEEIEDDDGELNIDDYIDVVGVKLMLNPGSENREDVMLNVIYQRGSTFNVLVPKSKKAILEHLEIGREIRTLEIYSSPIIFSEKCIVCEKSEMKYGQRSGDYSVSLKVLKDKSSLI